MMGRDRRGPRAPSAAVVALIALSGVTLAPAAPSEAQQSEVSGEAFGHYTKVGLFGGPQGVIGPAPRVTLPSTGSDGQLTDAEPDGAAAVYGPATMFGGRWPADLGTAPGSGPVNVSTTGTPGPGGSVTSTASITLHPKPVPKTCDGQPPGTKNCASPGGFGPVVPNEGDELHATCTANAKGVTGSARFVNAMLTTSTDEGGEPKDREPIPDNPPPNYTRTGVITNVGDRFKVVYNEQIVDPGGSLTVNAIHMYLLGDVTLGEQILGHVRCSMTPAETSATTALPGGASKANPPAAPADDLPPTRQDASSGSNGVSLLPLGLVALVPATGLAAVLLRSRRRRAAAGEPEADEPQGDPG